LVRIHFEKHQKPNQTEPIKSSLIRILGSPKTDPNRFNYTPTNINRQLFWDIKVEFNPIYRKSKVSGNSKAFITDRVCLRVNETGHDKIRA
jgi:hypothetical protein